MVIDFEAFDGGVLLHLIVCFGQLFCCSILEVLLRLDWGPTGRRSLYIGYYCAKYSRIAHFDLSRTFLWKRKYCTSSIFTAGGSYVGSLLVSLFGATWSVLVVLRWCMECTFLNICTMWLFTVLSAFGQWHLILCLVAPSHVMKFLAFIALSQVDFTGNPKAACRYLMTILHSVDCKCCCIWLQRKMLLFWMFYAAIFDAKDVHGLLPMPSWKDVCHFVYNLFKLIVIIGNSNNFAVLLCHPWSLIILVLLS